MSPSSNGRKGSLKSLFEDDNHNNNGEVRVVSKHVMNYNMMMQLSQNKAGAGGGAVGSGSGGGAAAAGGNGVDGMKKKKADKDAFERAVIDISCYNESPRQVFNTLRSVAKKLLKDDERYRTLDTTNPKVEERLLGYEGVIDFLLLLGFDSDAMGQRLVCKEKPDQEVIRTAIRVLDSHENRLKAAVHMDSAMLASGVQSSARNLSVVERPVSNSINANNADDNESDDMTLQQIVLLCTHEQQRDNETMETLIMCYKEFSTAEKLIKELKRRFFMVIPNEIREDEKKLEDFKEKTMKPIQLNVVKNLRNWMKLYWEEDFANDEKVAQVLESWIKQMQMDSKQFSWNGLLADAVQNEYKRYKKHGSKPRIQEKDYWSVEIPKRFNFHSLSPDELADQITLMDFRIFSRIKPRECMGQAWKKKENRVNSPHILQMIQQFNNLTTFVQIQILREKSLKDRGRAVKRIIKMGEHFRLARNFNSLCAVFSALNSAAVHRLKLAWEKVPEKQKQQFEQFKIIFSRDFNHRNLRQLFRNAAAPSIPHIGIFLQDLVFIDDGHENTKEVENLGGRKMVNFSKSQRMADRIKNIQMYQQHPYTDVQESDVVQRILLEEFSKLKEITEDQIWDMSTEVKRADERDKARIF
ncbi:Ras guanine nucleotide exchange factor [Reticulomyxa filosa]|uniref:Ras guanine nucleotide exchange factor n=1 Tax=Reticulomyxa filosa TaxID=46433 RepID=X6PFX5_RETFI|nr:Ras guanine nucleotide exchange factor [Reticulomyxa filosa]|eukprot:ETO37008.1 Ras guanine nucleotide exchange factor [Reticulomyxa filosa]